MGCGIWHRLAGTTLLALAPAAAMALEPLADAELGQVSGRDGLSIATEAKVSIGSFVYTTDTAGSGAALRLSDIRISGFSASMTDVVTRTGFSDAMVTQLPELLPSRWQVLFDWGVNADGIDAYGGSVSLTDLVLTGGGWAVSMPASGGGMTWGHSLRMDIGSMALQPRGRDAPAEQLLISGIHLGEATTDGSAPTQPWRLADVTSQPGFFNVTTQAGGPDVMRFGIGWPQAGTQAPTGMLVVDNITFQSDVTGTLNLGSSRIGGMQIQYLDVKLKP